MLQATDQKEKYEHTKKQTNESIDLPTNIDIVYVLVIWNSLRLDNTFHLWPKEQFIIFFSATWHDDLLDEKQPNNGPEKKDACPSI